MALGLGLLEKVHGGGVAAPGGGGVDAHPAGQAVGGLKADAPELGEPVGVRAHLCDGVGAVMLVELCGEAGEAVGGE